MFPINLVLFQWRLIFDTKLKKLRYLFSDLKLLTLKKSGSVRLNEHTQLGSSVRCFTGPGWSGRWWRLKRSSTNWSFFNKWFGTGFRINPGSQTSGFQPDLVSRLLAFSSVRFSARSIDRDSLVRSGLRVRYRIEYRASYLDLYLLNMNLNKVRD